MQDYEQKHIEALRAVASECTVLLKTNGDFPLAAPGKLALYGSGARNTLKGGTGSGDVNTRSYTTAEQGLEKAGFTLTTRAWMDAYDACRREAKAQFIEDIKQKAKELHTNAIMLGMGAVMPEPAYEFPLDGEGEAAVYVLSRICGEGNDRKAEAGDMLLTETEIREILRCREQYKKFLLVLNVGAPVDLSPVLAVENILILSQLGSATGDVLADILLGKANPSGKLTATWAAKDAGPAFAEFGEKDDTHYREGVYVGYRYFDSVGAEPLFPFGFGLSYTAFETGKASAAAEGREISVSAEVKNCGARAGKETLQLYVSAPWGRLDKPYQSLAAFRKTKELAPGESETLTLRFDLADLASYDEARAAYILEAGDYVLRLGTSSRDTTACAVVRLSGEILVRQLTKIGGKVDFEDWKPERPAAQEPGELPVLEVSAADFASLRWPAPAQPDASALAFVKQLKDRELVDLCVGAHGKGVKGAISVVGEASTQVAGAAGEIFGTIEGVRGLVMADGPAGLRLSRQYTKDKKGAHAVGATMPEGMADFLPPAVQKILAGKPPKGLIFEQYCTAIPIGTALAQSWNPALAELCGDVVGEEMERFGVDIWLAPAMNIQRNPLCGRNFEYFSEDPLLSGAFGAAITRGVQKHPGRAVTIKHFCCNNQEHNRYQSNSAVSERALREIYLKGFERCIREENPHCLMTSYNLLNGVHTAENADILKTVLRGEWGWRGLVMTDWIIGALNDKNSAYRPTRPAPTIKAGNDLFMPGSEGDCRGILQALKGKSRDFSLTRADLELCAAHIVETVRRLS